MYSSLYVPCASGAQVTSWVAFSRFLLESAFAVRLPPLLPELLRMQWAPGLHRGHLFQPAGCHDIPNRGNF